MSLARFGRSFAVVVAVAAAVAGCAPASDLPGSAEDVAADVEGLAGALPVGTLLVTTGNVNLRSGPSTSNAVLEVLAKGDKVTLEVSEPSAGFYRVEHDGVVGWSSGKYLEPADGGSSGPAGQTLVATGAVNLRSGPSTGDAILKVVPMGATVSVLSPEPVNGYYNVSYQGTVGWSSGKFLGAPGGAQTFAGGRVWKFHASTLSMDVAVFVPAAAEEAADVDVLVYAHGHNVCAPVATKPPVSFVTDAPFSMGEIVAASGRPVVLALPFLDWEHLAANGMAFSGKKHRLGIPKNLNGIVAEVLTEVGLKRGTSAPGLSHLLLAGHSRAYDFLNPLAAAHADPEMSSGALARLSRIWAFDTTYACSPISTWSSWLASKPDLEVGVWYRDVSGTSTCGHAFEGLEASSDGRLEVAVATESHCAVPGKRLPPLLAASP